MAARSSFFNRRVMQRREAFTDIVDSRFDFRSVLHAPDGSEADVFGDQFDVFSLADLDGPGAQDFQNWTNLSGTSDSPHAHGASIVVLPVLTPDDPARVDGAQVAPESVLDIFKERTVVVPQGEGQPYAVTDPIRGIELGWSPVSADFSTAIGIEESTKFSIPHVIHEKIVPQRRYNDESTSNRTVHWHDVNVSAATLGSNINSDLGYAPIPGITEDLIRNGEVIPLFGIPVATHALMTIDGSDDATGAVFSKEAFLYLSTSNTMKTETERDKNLRAWDMIITSEYGVGEVDDDWGFKIIADATAPTS